MTEQETEPVRQPKGPDGRFMASESFIPRPERLRFSAEDVRLVAELYAAGGNIHEIAEWTKTSVGVVRSALRKSGVSLLGYTLPKGRDGRFVAPENPIPHPWMRRISPEEAERIVDLHLAGSTAREIASQTGRSLTRVSHVIRKSGAKVSCNERAIPKGPDGKFVATATVIRRPWRQSKGADLFKAYERRYRNCARARGKPYFLTFEEFRTVVSQPCYYCGDPPRTRKFGPRTLIANGIDRQDNTVGYVLTNVVPCCTSCNKLKAARSATDFIAYCKKIVAHTAVHEAKP